MGRRQQSLVSSGPPLAFCHGINLATEMLTVDAR
jgi:hypothetical protein